jgi:hypothetical protein
MAGWWSEELQTSKAAVASRMLTVAGFYRRYVPWADGVGSRRGFLMGTPPGARNGRPVDLSSISAGWQLYNGRQRTCGSARRRQMRIRTRWAGQARTMPRRARSEARSGRSRARRSVDGATREVGFAGTLQEQAPRRPDSTTSRRGR